MFNVTRVQICDIKPFSILNLSPCRAGRNRKDGALNARTDGVGLEPLHKMPADIPRRTTQRRSHLLEICDMLLAPFKTRCVQQE